MPLAINGFKGVALATKGSGIAMAELSPVNNNVKLNDLWNVHFGINTNNYNDEIDDTDPMQKDLEGLGPRILDTINRGGRTAEDTWFSIEGGQMRQRGETPGFEDFYDRFNRKRKIKKYNYPPGAKINNVDVSGSAKYAADAVHKGQKNKYADIVLPPNPNPMDLQYGERWSKIALEHAAATPQGHIHFHLDGMGNINDLIVKHSQYSHNVTSRELRYVHRNWPSFQHKVIFYNGYTASPYRAVMVEAPWLWRPDSSALQCHLCHSTFSFFNRRHHCRRCGEIFCSKCSSHTNVLPYPIRRPGADAEIGVVRVCDTCLPLP